MWKALRSKLKILRSSGTSLIRPKQSELARFEKEFNFELPPSYKSFLRELGPGTIARYFFVLAPLYAASRPNMQQGIRKMRRNDVLREIFGKDLVARMVPFGGSTSGDIFAWDPTQRNARGEYSIFALPRDSEQVVWLAKDFRTFVHESCLHNGFFDALGYVLSESKPDWTFEPDVRKSPNSGKKKIAAKSASKKQNVPRKRAI